MAPHLLSALASSLEASVSARRAALSPNGDEGWKEELLFRAARIRSAVRGNWVTGAPAARETAFMTAAGGGGMAGSPKPLGPQGPRPRPPSRSHGDPAGG